MARLTPIHWNYESPTIPSDQKTLALPRRSYSLSRCACRAMQYPDVDTIHLVMDDLNIHCRRLIGLRIRPSRLPPGLERREARVSMSHSLRQIVLRSGILLVARPCREKRLISIYAWWLSQLPWVGVK
jgi:hypothetical protein